nr:hypothetical protein [Pandoravirus belohorizontensis]
MEVAKQEATSWGPSRYGHGTTGVCRCPGASVGDRLRGAPDGKWTATRQKDAPPEGNSVDRPRRRRKSKQRKSKTKKDHKSTGLRVLCAGHTKKTADKKRGGATSKAATKRKQEKKKKWSPFQVHGPWQRLYDRARWRRA